MGMRGVNSMSGTPEEIRKLGNALKELGVKRICTGHSVSAILLIGY